MHSISQLRFHRIFCIHMHKCHEAMIKKPYSTHSVNPHRPSGSVSSSNAGRIIDGFFTYSSEQGQVATSKACLFAMRRCEYDGFFSFQWCTTSLFLSKDRVNLNSDSPRRGELVFCFRFLYSFTSKQTLQNGYECLALKFLKCMPVDFRRDQNHMDKASTASTLHFVVTTSPNLFQLGIRAGLKVSSSSLGFHGLLDTSQTQNSGVPA
jgi:hypothetical protein